MTNINFFLPISIHDEKKRLGSPQGKCSDLLSNSPNYFVKEMYGDQFGEFVCGHWGLKG